MCTRGLGLLVEDVYVHWRSQSFEPGIVGIIGMVEMVGIVTY